MAKFNYNNTKNTNIYNILFELNYNYYLYILYKKNIEIYLKFQTINKYITKL